MPSARFQVRKASGWRFEAIHPVVEFLDDSRVLPFVFFSLVVVKNPGTIIGIFSGGDDFFVWRRFA